MNTRSSLGLGMDSCWSRSRQRAPEAAARSRSPASATRATGRRAKRLRIPAPTQRARRTQARKAGYSAGLVCRPLLLSLPRRDSRSVALHISQRVLGESSRGLKRFSGNAGGVRRAFRVGQVERPGAASVPGRLGGSDGAGVGRARAPGWHSTVSATTFTTGGGTPHTLADTGTFSTNGSVTSISGTGAPTAACASGSTCTVPTNTTTYPVASRGNSFLNVIVWCHTLLCPKRSA